MPSDPSMTRQAIREAADYIRATALDGRDDRRAGIVLGTGLGGLAAEIEDARVVPYEDIPHMPLPTVLSHEGQLIVGRLEGVPVAAMQGRLHAYEGYTLQEVTFGVRVLRALGADHLMLSGACGGMHPLWSPGDLVLLDDHINLLGDNPLIGPNLDDLGPRFPDMSQPYDGALQEAALSAAAQRGMTLRRGVYVAVLGPNLETRAEYRMLRAVGADVVGMSTVPEVIVARHMDMKVLAISIITDQCLPDALEPADIPTIIRTAQEAEPNVTRLMRDVIATLAPHPVGA